jgi:hypothetical protein
MDRSSTTPAWYPQMTEFAWDEDRVHEGLKTLEDPSSPESKELERQREIWRELSQEIIEQAIEAERLTEADLSFHVNAR